MDKDAVQDRPKWLQVLRNAGQATSQHIDSYVEYLIAFIQDLIHKTVPNRKRNRTSYSQPWWTTEVAELVAKERRARRAWTRTHTDQAWDDLTEASKAKRKRIASAKQAHWRQSVHEASISREGVRKLAKWARTKSFLPPEPPQMPDIHWRGRTYDTIEGKAKALCERFYPTVEADMEDIIDHELELPYPELGMDRRISMDEIWAVLRKVKPDKCPGADNIPSRFLKAMGLPLVRALQSLITAVITASYFPARFVLQGQLCSASHKSQTLPT